MRKLHFKFVADMRQNITCSGLENKCYFMESGGKKENMFFLGNYHLAFEKWQKKMPAECC